MKQLCQNAGEKTERRYSEDGDEEEAKILEFEYSHATGFVILFSNKSDFDSYDRKYKPDLEGLELVSGLDGCEMESHEKVFNTYME